MAYLVLLVVGIVSVAIFGGALFAVGSKASGGAKKSVGKLTTHLDNQKEIAQKIEELYGGMIDLGSVRKAVAELRTLQEALKAERGRITITQAELETVESRLRELEEIERELEASAVETKEELNILQKKQGELKGKNDELKAKIAESTSKLDSLVEQVELSSQAEEQMLAMKSQLIQTEQKVDHLLLQIEEGNQQYFILKQRYDALDIEYAQLYEKFAEADDGGGGDDE